MLSLLALLLAVTSVGGARLLDAAAVHSAAREVRDLLALARDEAVANGTRVAVRFETAPARVIVHRNTDTIARTELAHSDIRLEATRDSMAYGPSGLGVGAANLRLLLSRGTRQDTIVISRLGRVRDGG